MHNVSILPIYPTPCAPLPTLPTNRRRVHVRVRHLQIRAVTKNRINMLGCATSHDQITPLRYGSVMLSAHAHPIHLLTCLGSSDVTTAVTVAAVTEEKAGLVGLTDENNRTRHTSTHTHTRTHARSSFDQPAAFPPHARCKHDQ
jgi:hypothetical protein